MVRQEAASSRPLFVSIYTSIIIGIIISTVYIFSAFNSPHVLASSPISLTGVVSLPTSNNASKSSKLSNRAAKLTWEVPSPNNKMPPLKAFGLTKELVQQRVKDNVIIITFGNFAFMDFILNWVNHLTDLGISNLLVGALDTKLLEALYWKGIPVFDMGSHLSSMDVGWGTPTFYKIGRAKVLLMNYLLPFGYEILMCDTDTVWLKNPLPYLARYPEADILTSTDQVVPTVFDDRLDSWQQVNSPYNIGIFHWRPTESAKKLAKEWKELLMTDENIWDQTAFTQILQKQLGPSVDEETNLVYAFDGNLKLGFLPATIFCSGHTYFVQAMYQQLRLKPYVVHTTFQYAGTEGKRHRMREAMLFYDPPEYYNVQGGFMSFKPFIPKSMLFDGDHNINSHFNLINHQLKQIREALAIASLLNRTLVMPRLWCRIDRLWFPHPGKFEGSMTQQPFVCPLDHVFEIDVMLQKLPEEKYGPQIDIREYSFLDNPSLPQELKEVFSAFKDVKVIQFLSIQDAFSGFTDKVREAKFRKRVKQYVGEWCCLYNQTPGNIYYDMFWEEKPGWKPLPPKTPEEMIFPQTN
ncbi:hypothetical protein V2J09_020419 [Rumex salicifolius]